VPIVALDLARLDVHLLVAAPIAGALDVVRWLVAAA
jgi:hypothetical protein